MRTITITIGLTLVAAVAGVGCGSSDDGAGGDRLTVVATTGVAADLVRGVGGERVEVTTLIPAGADPHAYEPRPDDLKALANAKLIVRSGGEIDEWLDGAIESAGAGSAEQVTLLDATETGGAAPPADAGTEAGHAGDVDPHWWHDPRAALPAVDALEIALGAVDANGASAYRTGSEALRGRLERLDVAIEACLDRLPPEHRKLVTSHDALGRYARRYGLEVVGAVIPSRSTQARASSGALAELVDLIRRERIPAIFPESLVSPKVEEAVAREAGARIARPLYADGLGPEGSPGETYLGVLRSNTTAIVDALGTGPCELP